MASDSAQATKQLRKKIKRNEKKLSKDLASLNALKMGAMLKQLRNSVGTLRRQTKLPPEEALMEAKSRRQLKAKREVTFRIDREPELDEEILLQRNILTTKVTTDDSADSSVESDDGSCGLADNEDRHDLNLCVEVPEKVKSGTRGEDPWWLHPEDLEKPKHRQPRYFDVKCNQCEVCDMRGHASDKCPLGGPICVLCGKLGHRKHACRSVLCPACLKTGHDVRDCSLAAKRRDAKCLRCGTMGHIAEDCFEKWRQFHVTTAPGSATPVKSKQRANQLAYCSNCAKKGHFSEDCFSPHPRYRNLFSPGSAFVSSYDKQAVFVALPDTPRRPNENRKRKIVEEKEEEEVEEQEKGQSPPTCDEEAKKEAATRPADDTCETPRVRQSSDLGDFVPLGKDYRKEGEGEMTNPKRKTKKRRKKKRIEEEENCIESPDGVSLPERIIWNSIKNDDDEGPSTSFRFANQSPQRRSPQTLAFKNQHKQKSSWNPLAKKNKLLNFEANLERPTAVWITRGKRSERGKERQERQEGTRGIRGRGRGDGTRGIRREGTRGIRGEGTRGIRGRRRGERQEGERGQRGKGRGRRRG